MNAVEMLKNLVIMAVADKRLTSEEFQLVLERSIRWGVAEEELQDALHEAAGREAALAVPRDRESQEVLLRELVRMMGADGELADVEKMLFALAAAETELSEEEIESLVDRTLREGVD